MNKMFSLLILLFFLFAEAKLLHAQEAVLSSGGDASGSGGTVSYSIGQTAFEFFVSPEGMTAQGVQQPWEIFLVTAINNSLSLSGQFTIFPNPARNFLRIRAENIPAEWLWCRLFDASGRLCRTIPFIFPETSLDISPLSPGTYILEISNPQHEPLISHKIIKSEPQ